MLAYMMLGRGVGNVLSTPISASLLGGDARFGSMITYVGCCFAGATVISGAGWTLEKLQKKGEGEDET